MATSDADVLAHAIADAVLGAVGERDIGFHFPNSDESIRGISSLEILRKVAAPDQDAWADASSMSTPRSSPKRQRSRRTSLEMRAEHRRRLGDSPARRVGVKATTNERMGFAGRGEGIAALAVASVELSVTRNRVAGLAAQSMRNALLLFPKMPLRFFNTYTRADRGSSRRSIRREGEDVHLRPDGL